MARSASAAPQAANMPVAGMPKAAKAAKAAKPAAAAAKPAPSVKPAKAAAGSVNKSAAKTPAKPTPAAAAASKTPKLKDKLVRDSFTMPAAEFALIQQLKNRSLGFARATKKSELLRAGLQALATLSDAALKAALDKLPALKAGRPKKSD